MLRDGRRGYKKPFCKKPPFKMYPGEGGVDKSWWRLAMETYHWDVNPGTLVIVDDPLGDGQNDRYDVILRKKQ